MVAALDDSIAFSDTLTSQASFINHLRDGITFQARLRIDGQLYVGYVCNTQLRAYTEYADIPYNSMCELTPGVYYAAGPAGIYRIGGTTRDGAAIQSTLRSGLSNFGTGKLKRLPSAYFGYTSDGQVVIKVVTTSADGAKAEHWYEMVAKTADVTRENRIKIGRGLKSVYWQWELVATGPFSLDQVALHPLILDRRI
jgi:hypothetical protein